MHGSKTGNGAQNGIFAGLNNEQAEAVRYTGGPLLILAGAGSGKTRVLVHRIAYLIREAGVSPWSILGITFTNKAANEMKARVETLLPDESAAIWISTFHSACVRMLRRDIDRIGMSRNFSIVDHDDQIALIKKIISDNKYSDGQFVPKAVLEQIGRAKDEMVGADEYARLAGNDFYKGRIAEIYRSYQRELRKSNSLDFDDIIIYAVHMLRECGDLLDYYQNRFRHVLVDEYQDTNTAQYAFVSLISAKWKNICVVGDDDQSIYGWRGANIGNILGFEDEYRNAKIIKLEQNYRSTKIILSAANHVIRKNENRKYKKLWTDNEAGEAIGCVRIDNEHEEASFVAKTIKRLRKGACVGYNDFAVLYRINAQSRAIENTFVREGIPYRIIGGFKFFERKEIKDIVAYLRLLQNTSDDIGFKRIINVPKRGIGAATIEKLESIAAARDISIYEACAAALRSPKDHPELKISLAKLKQFMDLMEKLVTDSRNMGIIEILDHVLERTGIYSMYNADKSEDSMARLENIMEFKSEIIEFEKHYISDDVYYEDGGRENPDDNAENAGVKPDGEAEDAGGKPDGEADDTGGKPDGDAEGTDEGINDADGNPHAGAGRATSLSEFLMHVSLISDIDNYDEENEKVSLMTMHSAKGLEFDTVFIVGAEEGIFPGLRSMSSPSLLEEERRLCYVAITRAKNRLFFTNAASRTLFGNTTYNMASRFVGDIPENLKQTEKEERRNIISITEILNRRKKAFAGGFMQPFPRNAPAGIDAPRGGPNASQEGPDATDGYGIGRVYSVGDRVGHKKYGSGIVKNRYFDRGDYIIEIEFNEAGLKRFIESMVNLRIEGGA